MAISPVSHMQRVEERERAWGRPGSQLLISTSRVTNGFVVIVSFIASLESQNPSRLLCTTGQAKMPGLRLAPDVSLTSGLFCADCNQKILKLEAVDFALCASTSAPPVIKERGVDACKTLTCKKQEDGHPQNTWLAPPGRAVGSSVAVLTLCCAMGCNHPPCVNIQN